MTQLLDNFNYGRFDADDWTQIRGGSVRSGFTSGAHSLFFGGNDQRVADTIALNVSNGGTISFYLIFGDGSNGGDNAELGEDVALEYSTDGGATWGLISTYDSEDYTSWARITENVPTAALSSATRFRWRQLDFDSSTTAKGLDNWGLDHVQIADAALTPVDGVFDDFNNSTIDWDNWADLKGGSVRSGFTTGAHSLFFGSSSDGDGQRLLASMPVDVSSGGSISFFLRFGDGDNGGDNADPGEDVVLEYSIDGGANWINLNTYDTEDYSSWTRITEDVPAAALGAATRFRWRQLDFDNGTTAKGRDNWGLDHITISGNAVESLDRISDDFNNRTTDWENWADIKGGSVRSGFTNGAHSLFFGSSGEAGGQRLAATNPVDVSTGGTVSFNLVMGNGNNGGANVDPGEDVVLEYSLDGGSSWVLLNLYDSEDYTSWTRINENVPIAALSDATRFRLRQLSFNASGVATGNDNWGIDNFRVARGAIAPQTQVVDDFNNRTVDLNDWVDIKGGSVRSGFTTGAHSLYFGSSSDGGGATPD